MLTTSVAFAATIASAGERAVSGLVIISSTHRAKEKVVEEASAVAGAAATEATRAKTATLRAKLTIVTDKSMLR